MLRVGRIFSAVATCATLIVTRLKRESPAEFVTVTRNRYKPAFPNVTLLFFAALVPLTLKTGSAAPNGLRSVVHVYVRSPSVESGLSPSTVRSKDSVEPDVGVPEAGVTIVGRARHDRTN